MRRRRDSHVVDQRGLTVVELIIAVTISALIIAPLGGVLTQALNLIPENGERTKAATDRARLVWLFASDVAQSQGTRERFDFSSSYPAPGSKTVVCPGGTTAELNALQATPGGPGPPGPQTSLVTLDSQD